MNPDFASPVGDLLYPHATATSVSKEEIAKMVESFGNLPEQGTDFVKQPMKAGEDPLQGFDLKFMGLDHAPVSYTLNLMDEVLHIGRGLFFDDLKHIPEGRIPAPDTIAVIAEDGTRQITLILELEKQADDDQAYAEILDIDGESGRKVTMIELVYPIAEIRVIESGLVRNAALSSSEEQVDG